MTLLFHRIQQLSRDLNQYLNQALAQEDISMSHWAVLFQLGQHGGMTQSELKTRLNIEAPPLSRTIRKLEELGYVAKYSSEDKRTNDVILTEKGKARFPVWKKAIQEAETHLRDQLGPEREQELEKHVHTLSRVINSKGGDRS